MTLSRQIFILVIVVALFTTFMDGRPHDKTFTKTKYGKCDRNSNVDTNCQKCAKITKSPIVYPMCCTNQEEVYRWCYSYLNFGLQKRTILPPIIRKNFSKIKIYDTSKLTVDHAANKIG